MIAAAIKDADANQGQRANQTILALRGKLSSASLVDDKNEQLKCLKDDVDGRISKALTGKERFVRWGRHYLRAINRSHQVQQCTNFMDPGLQVYGGGLFKEVQDLGGKAFLELPAPKPARRPSSACLSHYANPKPSANMQTYYAGAGGGCFGAESSVVVVRGDGREVRTRITDVVAGDSVRVPDGTARVVCCARISRPGKGLLRFPGGLTITPRHPVRVDGQWRHPGDLGQADPVPNPSGYVYNVLLDRCHILLVDGLECITWGHKLPDPAHEFFGSERVVGALAELPGWSRGLVLIDAYLRDARTGRVAGFLGAEQGGTPEILPDARRMCAV